MSDAEIESLKNELEHEKTCRDSAQWHNNELDKQIKNIEEELRQSDYEWSGDEDLVKENSKHKLLLESIENLKEQLPLLRDRIRNAKICGPDCRLKHDDLNINLDLLTPAELLRTVKRFERLKTDLISTLRSKEWRLDSESKLYTRVHDQRTYLQNELMIVQNNIMRLQKNGPYWHILNKVNPPVFRFPFRNHARNDDQRVLDPKRGPIKKYIGNERLPPIAT